MLDRILGASIDSYSYSTLFYLVVLYFSRGFIQKCIHNLETYFQQNFWYTIIIKERSEPIQFMHISYGIASYLSSARVFRSSNVKYKDLSIGKYWTISPMIMHVERFDKQKEMYNQVNREMRISTPFWNKQELDKFFEGSLIKEDTLKIMIKNRGLPRGFDIPKQKSTVVGEACKALSEDFEMFISNRHAFEEFNNIYKRGYLLYGPPGTGKTSAIKSLASYYDAVIVIVSDPHDITSHYTDPAGSISPTFFVIEDFNPTRKKNKKKRSTWLNVLDGIQSRSNCVFFFTANDISGFDKAFIRPGRIDRVIQFDYPTDTDLFDMVDSFFPHQSHNIIQHMIKVAHKKMGDEFSIAAFKGCLLDLYQRQTKMKYSTLEWKVEWSDIVHSLVKERKKYDKYQYEPEPDNEPDSWDGT